MADFKDTKITDFFQFAHYSKTSASQDLNASGLGTITAISWDVEDHEDANFTHDNSTNNSRVVVGMTGRYAMKASVAADSLVVNRWVGAIYLRVNGTTDKKAGIGRGSYTRGASYNDEISMLIVTELELTADDYIEVMVETENSSDGNNVDTIDAECELIIRCI